MKTKKLKSNQVTQLWRCIKAAQSLRLVPALDYERNNFLRRARSAFRRNLEEPGDCKGDIPLLAALSVAEAQVPRSPGWIPEVQRIAFEIINKPGF